MKTNLSNVTSIGSIKLEVEQEPKFLELPETYKHLEINDYNTVGQKIQQLVQWTMQGDNVADQYHRISISDILYLVVAYDIYPDKDKLLKHAISHMLLEFSEALHDPMAVVRLHALEKVLSLVYFKQDN